MTQNTALDMTQNLMNGPEPGSEKVLVAMSGGVDSSVAAALLKSQGHDVVGVHMQLWDHSDQNLERMGGRCCSIVDSNDARRVCDKIEIPFYVINAQDEFKEAVVDYFVHEYLQSRTPNPCVQCNTKIKFSSLFQKADELGCKWLATGHYAQVQCHPSAGYSQLLKATDPQKDQSYFLFGLTQKALTRTMMPLGGMAKMTVRKLAEQFGLAVAGKEDSMEICFIGSEGYAAFLESRSAPTLRGNGPIQSVEGQIMGEHRGLYQYTIGQRRGLQLKAKGTENWFVLGLDPVKNTLTVGPEEHLYKKTLFASHVSWVRPIDQLKPLHCTAKIRARADEAQCIVTCFENNTVTVEFLEPQRAITPGQAVVFYQKDEVLGGAFIDHAGQA